jgi:peptidoglycan L-alanyl-D-glutamate endopeptidase CwlK
MIAAGVHDVKGRPLMPIVTNTLNSNHFRNWRTGFGHAVDLVPWINGAISWGPHALFVSIADAMKQAAKDQGGVPLEWGFNLWRWDAPHFQLPKSYRA